MKIISKLMVLAFLTIYGLNANAITCAQLIKARSAHRTIYIKHSDGTVELVKRCTR